MSTVNDINDAITVAEASLKGIIKKAKDISVEEAVVVDGNIEVTLSYSEELNQEKHSPVDQLVYLLGERKKWRIFIIDKDAKTFKGFRMP